MHFSEEKEDKKKQPQPSQYASPFYFYPQTFINNNYQQMAPPPGWTIAHGNTISPPMLPPYSENVSFVQPNIAPKVTPPDINVIRMQDGETPTDYTTKGQGQTVEETKSNTMSPLAAFCASLFRPATANSPLANCEQSAEKDVPEE